MTSSLFHFKRTTTTDKKEEKNREKIWGIVNILSVTGSSSLPILFLPPSSSLKKTHQAPNCNRFINPPSSSQLHYHNTFSSPKTNKPTTHLLHLLDPIHFMAARNNKINGSGFEYTPPSSMLNHHWATPVKPLVRN